MATKTINAELLTKMFLAGAANLEAKKEFINELNVFPVPDGDTGTNMTLTIMSAAKEVSALSEPDMLSVSKAISSGSLRGARGNSGVILSQLLRGFTKEIREHKEIDVEILAAACERATATAYKAVMKPKEGTILTVAKGAAEKARELAETTDRSGSIYRGGDRRGKKCSGENAGYASGLKRSRRCGFWRTGTVGSDERRVRCISRKRDRLQRDRSKFRNDDGKTGGAGTGGY